MNPVNKVLIAANVVAIVAIVAAVATVRPMDAQGLEMAAPMPKDQSRLPSKTMSGSSVDYADGLLELAQMSKPPLPRPFGPPNPPFANPDGPYGAGQRGFEPPFGPPPGPPPMRPIAADRRACAETIDRAAGMAGYLKSKLNMDGAQKDAWQKIEQAAEPVVVKMRQICATLPDEPDGPPNFPAVIALADRQFAVRAEFVHAILGPAKGLYDMLSPEQRAILDRPLPPPAL